MGIKIITDSTADIVPNVKKEVKIVPLTVRFGDTEYIDGVNLTQEEFYAKLVESDTLPTTSQATPDAFERAYKEVTDSGDVAIVITLSSRLSGTYQSAMIAAADYSEKVYVIDSFTTAIGMGILVEYALKLVNDGLSVKEIVNILEEKKKDIYVIAMLDTLEYLKKGGRISKTAAVAGELLSIKPVVAIKDGEIKILGKARGSKQGNNLLVKEINGAGGVDFDMPLLLGYTGLTDSLLKKYINDSSMLWEEHTEALRYSLVSGVIGTHAGPGAVAAAFFKK